MFNGLPDFKHELSCFLKWNLFLFLDTSDAFAGVGVGLDDTWDDNGRKWEIDYLHTSLNYVPMQWGCLFAASEGGGGAGYTF